MELHEHDKYNGSLRARKSWFFFDNRIVCMGSDIENKAEGGVHTTLFQNFLADAADPLVVNGEAVTQFPYRAELAGGAVLRDNLRNAYFVPKGRVVVSKSLQRSLDEETDAPTQNNFATAWIDHGSGSVSGGGYEYMLAVHASDEEAAATRGNFPTRCCAATPRRISCATGRRALRAMPFCRR